MLNELVHVIGAGGHAKVVISVLRVRQIPIAGVLDDSPEKWGKPVMGCVVEGPITQYRERIRKGIIAIGDNRARQRVAQSLPHIEWISVWHPAAFVDSTVQIGAGTVIFAGAVVQPESRLGNHCIVNTCASVDHDCKIGSYVHIAPGARLAGGVQVGDGALIGVGALILPHLSIGSGSIVGGGAVVTRDVPPYAVVVGNPARIIRMVEHE